jgi:hypothetical protein
MPLTMDQIISLLINGTMAVASIVAAFLSWWFYRQSRIAALPNISVKTELYNSGAKSGKLHPNIHQYAYPRITVTNNNMATRITDVNVKIQMSVPIYSKAHTWRFDAKERINPGQEAVFEVGQFSEETIEIILINMGVDVLGMYNSNRKLHSTPPIIPLIVTVTYLPGLEGYKRQQKVYEYQISPAGELQRPTPEMFHVPWLLDRKNSP